MFCFPYPQDDAVQPIRVPLLRQAPGKMDPLIVLKTVLAELYKPKPAKCGGKDGAKTSAPPSAASVLQTYLYFGLASEALGRPIRPEEFTGIDPHSLQRDIDIRIPTWYWRQVIARWNGPEGSLATAESKANRVQLKSLYQNVLITLVVLDSIVTDLDDDLLLETLLSIHLLLHFVAYVLSSDQLPVTHSTETAASTMFLKRRMVRNGWCERRLNLLGTSPMTYPALYFLASLRPPRLKEENHSSCSSERCLFTTESSKPLHRTEDCTCGNVTVSGDRVNAIVASGGVPLVRIARLPSGKVELDVVPYTPSSKFVAVSHVWADQQFGSAHDGLPECQVAYLGELFSTLPTRLDEWGVREWYADWWAARPKEMAPLRGRYEYFWLDSFCVPQAVEHAELRSKAIKSMNFIYAAASYTVVLDKGLQALDAGQRPASLAHGGRPSYNCPRNENLLDVVGSIYASNWMGRAWTLQEGILSMHLVFPLQGSLAKLKLLRPSYDEGFGDFMAYLVRKVPESFKPLARTILPRMSKGETESAWTVSDNSEPFHDLVREQLFIHLKGSLQVEEYSDYTRTPAERSSKFLKSHLLLQSRTTTKAEDLALILMNMCGLNAISQSNTIDARMKQLLYSLDSIPVELLFSDCARLGQRTVDAWIPREIVPETFESGHILRLCSIGFTFETNKASKTLQFYLMPSLHQWNRCKLTILDLAAGKNEKYNVELLRRPESQHNAVSPKVYCIVVDDPSTGRGALFVVNRIVGNHNFLHFDCPLRLTEIDGATSPSDDQQDLTPEYVAYSSSQEFVIERSNESDSISISRPQNPQQYSDRIIVLGQAICKAMQLAEIYIIRTIWGDENSMSMVFYLCYGWFTFKKYQWVEGALQAFMHRAWMATYKRDWDPNGRWKWFWKLSNWAPPVPFSTMMKWCCSFTLFHSIAASMWSGVIMITAYWLPLYPTQELIGIYIVGFLAKLIAYVFF